MSKRHTFRFQPYWEEDAQEVVIVARDRESGTVSISITDSSQVIEQISLNGEEVFYRP